MPNIKSIKKWIKDLVTKTRLLSKDGIDEDKNLMKELEKLALEQGI